MITTFISFQCLKTTKLFKCSNYFFKPFKAKLSLIFAQQSIEKVSEVKKCTAQIENFIFLVYCNRLEHNIFKKQN